MTNHRPTTSAAWDDLATLTYPAPTTTEHHDPQQLDRARAAGVPLAYVAPVRLTLDRADFLHIVSFLEDRAKTSSNYHEIRQAVLFVEMLRDQARPQLNGR